MKKFFILQVSALLVLASCQPNSEFALKKGPGSTLDFATPGDESSIPSDLDRSSGSCNEISSYMMCVSSGCEPVLRTDKAEVDYAQEEELFSRCISKPPADGSGSDSPVVIVLPPADEQDPMAGNPPKAPAEGEGPIAEAPAPIPSPEGEGPVAGAPAPMPAPIPPSEGAGPIAGAPAPLPPSLPGDAPAIILPPSEGPIMPPSDSPILPPKLPSDGGPIVVITPPPSDSEGEDPVGEAPSKGPGKGSDKPSKSPDSDKPSKPGDEVAEGPGAGKPSKDPGAGKPSEGPIAGKPSEGPGAGKPSKDPGAGKPSKDPGAGKPGDVAEVPGAGKPLPANCDGLIKGEKGNKRVIICHNTSSKSHPSHTIEIACPALKAHVGHHLDTLGACKEEL